MKITNEKTKPKKLLFYLVFNLFCVFVLEAQNSSIKGLVTGDGEPLIGVAVKVKELPNIFTITDLEGRFTISLPSGSKTLSISYLGFKPQDVEIGTQSDLNIRLISVDKSLDEVVVVGYGSMKKRDLTGAISSISSDAITARSSTNALDAINGSMAGVQVMNSNGTPGSAPDIRIRGTSTFGDGYKPLYVVDGVIQDDISNLSPTDIKSMEVLKDAASAAIYGSRSGNGVVLITTKSGAQGMPTFSINYLHSFGRLSRVIPHANLQQRSYYDTQRKLAGSPSYYAIVDTLSAYANSDVDFFKELFTVSQRDQIDFNIANGSDKANYFISAGYLNEKGIIVNSGYQRLNWRMNADYKFSPKMTFGTRLSMSYTNNYGLSGDNAIQNLMIHNPYFPVYNTDGSFVANIDGLPNVVALAKEGINQQQGYNASNYNYLEIKILPNLFFKTNVQGTLSYTNRQSRIPRHQVGQYGFNTGSDVGVLNYNYSNENYFNYNLKRTNYSLTAMLGASLQSWSTFNKNIYGLDYSTDAIYTMNGVSSFDTRNTVTNISRHTMASAFSRITYTYKDKYMFNGTLREDGSSRFGANTKWGLFPSASLGWRISQEEFMKATNNFMNDAKLRISWGIAGNEAIGNYDALQLYSSGNLYTGISGIAPLRMANPALSWENTTQYNGGLDLSFFEGRAKIAVDAYLKNTSNLLYNVPLPSESGFSQLRQNIGAMQSKGLDFNFDVTAFKSKDWLWTMGFNISFNNSTIVKLANGVPFYQGANNAIYIQENGRVGEIYGYKFQGIFAYNESNAFTPDYKEQLTPVFSNGVFQNSYILNGQAYSGIVAKKYDSDKITPLKGGDMNFQDLDGDGVITFKDRMLLGCAQPLARGGFNSTLNYKSLTVTATFTYLIGATIYNDAEATRNLAITGGYTPSPSFIDNFWTKQGDVTNYPGINPNTMNNRMLPSSFYVEDASYIKLSSLRMNYSFNKKTTSKLNVKDFSMYIYGNNLLTFTNFSGFDPEIPSSGTALSFGIYSYKYPQKTELGLGFIVKL